MKNKIITAKTVSNFEECIEYAKSNGMNVINYNPNEKECNPVRCDGEDAKSLMMDVHPDFEVYACQVSAPHQARRSRKACAIVIQN